MLVLLALAVESILWAFYGLAYHDAMITMFAAMGGAGSLAVLVRMAMVVDRVRAVDGAHSRRVPSGRVQ